jgi:hypothetical protein
MNTSWMPWWLYRLALRWRSWRNSGAELNKRVAVENVLLAAAKDVHGLSAEQCRALAYKLGTLTNLTSK